MNICIHAFIHSTVWRTCERSGSGMRETQRQKKKWGDGGQDTARKRVPDGEASKDKGKEIGRYVSRVGATHEDRKVGHEEQRNKKRQNKN